VTFPDVGTVTVFNEKQREKTWEFDEVFGLDSTQDQVYAEVSGLITSVLDGYNVCIFACKLPKGNCLGGPSLCRARRPD
jgi:Microtubule binding